MNWWKIIKMPYERQRAQHYRDTYWGAVPEPIKYQVMDALDTGASNILPGQFPTHGASLTMTKLTDQTHKLPTNRWKPRLKLENGIHGIFMVYDWDKQDFRVNEDGSRQGWESMMITSDDEGKQSQFFRNFTGGNVIPLRPTEVGVIVWQKMLVDAPDKTKYGAEFYFGKDSLWFGQGRRAEAIRGRMDDEKEPGLEMLTNADGAMLWLMARATSRPGAPTISLKERKQYFEEANLGEYDATKNPRMKDLLNRGFLRLPERGVKYKEGEPIREMPIISDKGRAHAPDMEPSRFQQFMKEVRSDPDGPLMLGDFGEWLGDETAQGPVMDVGEMSKDKRPEYRRKLEDRSGEGDY